MGVAIYIVVQDQPEDLDLFVNGKAIGHAAEPALEQLCRAAGVAPLAGYISQSPEELRELMEEFGGEVPDDLPDEQWFAPAEGLALVQALIGCIEVDPQVIENSADILEDLREFAEVFAEIARRGLRWHLAVDY